MLLGGLPSPLKESPESMKKALIVDCGNPDSAAEIPFLLKSAGCAVDVMCMPESWLLKCSYVDRRIAPELSPLFFATGRILPEGLARLGEIARSGEYGWIILDDDTALCSAADYFREKPSVSGGPDSAYHEAFAEAILPVTKPGSRIMIGSKAGLHVLCEKYGIDSPAGAVYQPGADLDELLRAVPFPLMLKVDRSCGGDGVFLCRDRAELEARLGKLSDSQKKELLLQEYIPGDIYAVEAFFGKGMLLSYAFSTVLQNIGGPFGVSAERRYEPCPEIEPALRHIGSSLGLHGFCSMTFLLDGKKKRYSLIEADLRPNAWFPLARFAGIDFRPAVSALASGDFSGAADFASGLEPASAASARASAPVIRYFPRCIQRAIADSDLREPFRWIFDAGGRRKQARLYDPKLFLYTCAYFAKMLARRTLAPGQLRLLVKAYRRLK